MAAGQIGCLMFAGLLVSVYLSITGLSIQEMVQGATQESDPEYEFISGRRVIDTCDDIWYVDRSGNITSICNPCDKDEKLVMCSIGCADSQYRERLETFYGLGDASSNHYKTDFNECPWFWQQVTIDIVPVTHSTKSMRTVIVFCSMAIFLNSAVLMTGVWKAKSWKFIFQNISIAAAALDSLFGMTLKT